MKTKDVHPIICHSITFRLPIRPAFVLAMAALTSTTSADSAVSGHRDLLINYCVSCHDDSSRTAGLSFEELDVANVASNTEIWERVVHKLRTRAMPPPDEEQLAAKDREALYQWLITSLDKNAQQQPNPGRPAVYRLNRAEYANAIRDLLAVEVDVRSMLPPDGSDFGFDNIADSLTVSPMLLERYMVVASKVSRLALGDPNIRPNTQSYRLPAPLVQDNRMSEDHPFGTRGGTSVRHHFPHDADYLIKLHIGRALTPQQIDVRVDGKRVALLTTDTTAGRKPTKQGAGLEARFAAKAGTRTVAVSFRKKTLAREGVAPSRLPPGGRFGAQTGGGPGLTSFDISGPYDSTGVGRDRKSLAKIFARQPIGRDDEAACAKETVAALLRRAFRRPIRDDDVRDALRFYEVGRAEGGFDVGIRWALERILVDPEFLFRVESDPPGIAPGAAYTLSDIELASRLSFFLWSSIPDDELVLVAERGELSDPAILEQQVRRMLADDRSDALVTNFAAQWLHLRNVAAVTPDYNTFPEFDENLRMAFRRETEMFIGSQLREDRSVVELLSADYTFVNERLARHYGIRNVYGSRFRRVSLDGSHRGGLLGHGSILTVTSYATRTSPVKRGKWLLENILGAPPAPPPADVPDLPDARQGDERMTMRERLELHRTEPTCASCHVQMDPLGFALENFDGIGQWRTTDLANLLVDANGTLPDGKILNGLPGLRNTLLQRSDEFVLNVTEKLLTYALGRGVEYYDKPAIRKIARDAAAGDNRWSAIILGIAKSTPFQMRRASGESHGG